MPSSPQAFPPAWRVASGLHPVPKAHLPVEASRSTGIRPAMRMIWASSRLVRPLGVGLPAMWTIRSSMRVPSMSVTPQSKETWASSGVKVAQYP